MGCLWHGRTARLTDKQVAGDNDSLHSAHYLAR